MQGCLYELILKKEERTFEIKFLGYSVLLLMFIVNHCFFRRLLGKGENNPSKSINGQGEGKASAPTAKRFPIV